MSAVSDIIASLVALAMVSVAASALATAKRILLVSFEPATDPSMARNALSTAPPVVDSLTIPTATDRAIFALISSVAVADVTVDANFRSTGSEIVSGVELTPDTTSANALDMASEIVLGVTVSDTNSAEYGLETGKDMSDILLVPDKIVVRGRDTGKPMLLLELTDEINAARSIRAASDNIVSLVVL